uniref:Uncharacterized protein n=1 Tax=Tanacetum cinerariifolium TaxID=118510 RepID=A0A699H2H8_TANCI|nr:hypothetical protein [Tanacetum cinerariifolium]
MPSIAGRCTLGAGSRETRDQEACLALPDNLPKGFPESLRGDSSGCYFGDLRRHVPPVSCDQLFRLFFRAILPSGEFRPSVVYSFYLPFSLHHMSFGSENAGDAVVLKFDMHVYPSVMTFDEVKNLVAGYAIHLDLHPCVPPSGLTRLPVDKIVATSMSQFLKFHMAGGVCIGNGTALAAGEVIPQHTTPPLPSGSSIPEKSDHQKVVEVKNERVLAANRKARAAKDRAVGKRAATERASYLTKRKKTATLSFALSDSETNKSNRSGSGTHHSASPFNTIIPNEGELATGIKAACSEEEAQAFLATVDGYDPTCKETFMSEFDSLFDKSYPYVEKLAESFRLPLGDLQNMWPEVTRPTSEWQRCGCFECCGYAVVYRGLSFVFVWASLGHWLLDSSGTSFVPGNGRHLAIGSWTHPERLAFRVTGVTWPLSLGLIRNVLRSG